MIAPKEPVALRKTVVGGDALPDDFLVIWDKLPIGRILRQPGIPSDRPNWSWGIILPTRPQLSWMRGICSDLEECQRRFKVAWSAVHRELTIADVDALRRAEQTIAQRPWTRRG